MSVHRLADLQLGEAAWEGTCLILFMRAVFYFIISIAFSLIPLGLVISQILILILLLLSEIESYSIIGNSVLICVLNGVLDRVQIRYQDRIQLSDLLSIIKRILECILIYI